MSVFRQRRFGLLLLVVFISVMLVWRPWGGLEPQARGLNFGIDIAGGSRVVLRLDMSHAAENTSTENLGSAATSLLENTISKLQMRTDPYGLLGLRFRTLGENSILCETTQLNDRTKKLLTEQGRAEIFRENDLIITGEDIESFSVPVLLGRVSGSAYYSISVKYRGYYATVISFVFEDHNVAGVVYLDRPSDAILIFDEGILNGVSNVIRYDNSAHEFVCTTEDILRLLYFNTGGELQYPLLVNAVETSTESLSPEARGYLENNVGIKSRVIFLGTMENFANVAGEIPENYRRENVSRLEGESVDGWIRRACGVISNFSGPSGLADNRIVIEGDLQEVRDIRAILSNELPVGLTIAETESKSGLGGEFLARVLIIGAVVLAGVFLLVYFRYRRWKICLAIIGIAMCEFAITLGATSVLGLAIGLPEIGGLLLVIGTGIDHQLIVTDEMLQGGSPQAKSVSVGWRASRALTMVYAAIFMIIAAMIPIALLGFSAIRGFTIIVITGTILALLFTRSFYAKIIDAISAG